MFVDFSKVYVAVTYQAKPFFNPSTSLRSWRDAWAGEAAIFLAGEAREEFSSGEAASEIPGNWKTTITLNTSQ